MRTILAEVTGHPEGTGRNAIARTGAVSGGKVPAMIFARHNGNMHEWFEAFASGEPLSR